MGLRVHDLLRLTSPAAIEAVGPPAWVAASLEAAPWVVVRRAVEIRGWIAVGVRGRDRSERFACLVSQDAVAEIASPKDLAPRGRLARTPTRLHPAFDALVELAPAFDSTGLVWGPAGAAGFELASGRAALTAASDLDIVARAPNAEPSASLERIAAAAARASLTVDVLIETPLGGVALAEALSGGEDILLRTPDGPWLVARAELNGGAPC